MHIDVLYWDALLHHNFHEILLTISTWRRGNTHTCRVLWMEFLFLGIENRACFCFRGCCCVLCRNAYRTQPATIKKKNNNNTLFSESLLFGCKFDNVPHNFYVEKNISANTQQLCAVASTSFYWRWDVNSLVILHTHVISLVLALVFIFIMIILLVFFFSLSFNVFFHMFPQHARSFTIHKFCFFFAFWAFCSFRYICTTEIINVYRTINTQLCLSGAVCLMLLFFVANAFIRYRSYL